MVPEPLTSPDAPRLVDPAGPGLADGLGSLWLAVVRAGGAIGFPADAPEPDIRAAAAAEADHVRAGRLVLIVLGPDHAPVGTVFLRRGRGPVFEHRADVVRLMVHPGLQGRGLGRSLLDAAVAHARALGLEQLLLSTRGGTHLPGYYAGLGWTEVGVFPGALHVGPGDVRDEHWFQLRLRRS